MSDTAKRFDSEKIRLDLVPPSLQEEVGKILTFGAKKYGDHNWRKGMNWSRCIGSLKRHLSEFEKGIDRDFESGELHISHLLCNAAFLLEYYKIAPQFDDRPHAYLKTKRIGLDIDDVLADWAGTFCSLAKIEVPKKWNFGFPEIVERLIKEGVDYKKVMENLPVKTKPEDIPFEPVCYITHRMHTGIEVAEEWLRKNGFPMTRVIQTADKIGAAREMELDYFVDDKYETFVTMNNAGICTFLFDAPHNQRYDVGHKRIKSLKELI